MQFVDTDITIMDEKANNTDVSYDLREDLSTMNPIPNGPNNQRRYVPLLSFLPSKNGGTNTNGIQEDTRYDGSKYVNIYYQTNTQNQSFMDMHYYLKAKGIKNNKFHLLLYDKDLAYIDPHDPTLPPQMKQKVFLECQRNFWYYIREVVRVQSQGSRNANMIFLNKKHDDAKRNLSSLKDLIKALPSYLRFDQAFGVDGKKLKASNTVSYLQHKINFNNIKALPMARNRTAAISLLRGQTITNCWIDESAFFQYLEESLQNGMPALTTAFRNCRMNGAPHGLCLTSTPGFLTTEEGQYMYDLKNKMTPFSELWYDFSLQKLTETLNANEKSIFVYIKTTYQQLGLSEEWLKERIKEQNQKWTDIRREFLLEWATSSDNCPFTQEELRNVEKFVRAPIKQVYISNFLFNIYSEIAPRDKVLIGVDVAAGYSKDSSAISVTSAQTTKLVADFNCNYINPVDLAGVIFTLVTEYLPNSLITIERNGVGTGTLAKLIKSKIRNNLYFEIKERVIEERPDGFRTRKR